MHQPIFRDHQCAQDLWLWSANLPLLQQVPANMAVARTPVCETAACWRRQDEAFPDAQCDRAPDAVRLPGPRSAALCRIQGRDGGCWCVRVLGGAGQSPLIAC